MTPHEGARAAYETTIVSDDGGSVTRRPTQVVVDAETGGLLYRQNVVDNVADNPTWNAFTIAPQTTPINKFPWGYPSNDTRQFWCWTAVTSASIQAQDTSVVYPLGVASKFPWDVNLDSAGREPRHDADDRQQRRRRPPVERGPRRVRQPGALPRDERDARLPLPVHERLVHVGLQPART